jgi:hypothetical protein
MSDRAYEAMRRAVDLARSGRCHNWWTVQARLRAEGFQIVHLEWTAPQRDWLNRLCAEAPRYGGRQWP